MKMSSSQRALLVRWVAFGSIAGICTAYVVMLELKNAPSTEPHGFAVPIAGLPQAAVGTAPSSMVPYPGSHARELIRNPLVAGKIEAFKRKEQALMRVRASLPPYLERPEAYREYHALTASAWDELRRDIGASNYAAFVWSRTADSLERELEPLLRSPDDRPKLQHFVDSLLARSEAEAAASSRVASVVRDILLRSGAEKGFAQDHAEAIVASYPERWRIAQVVRRAGISGEIASDKTVDGIMERLAEVPSEQLIPDSGPSLFGENLPVAERIIIARLK